jgi:TolB-like protein/Tfp pilus assembly protein PilF
MNPSSGKQTNVLGGSALVGEVRCALEKMLASPAFGRTERPGRFLSHLVERTLAGESATLKESLIGCEVFGRPIDWDPRIEPVVRQEAARLRKRIKKYYDRYYEENGNGNGSSPEIRIELPVGTYVPVFFRGAPDETDTEALFHEPVDASENGMHVEALPVPASRSHLLHYLAGAALLACALIAGVAWRIASSRPSIRIAVLPFANASNDPADQYFVDGFTSEMADSLSHFKNVSVVPRAQVVPFRSQKTANWRGIASQTGATHLVEGSLERSGDRVNLVVSLIDAKRTTKLWTNTYRRNSADVNAMEVSITQSVASTLGLAAVESAVGANTHVPPPEAHDYLLKATYEGNLGTLEANAEAQDDFRRAIALDPQYVRAYTGLAQVIWNANIVAGKRPLPEERRKSEELWQKALEIDATYAPAHSGIAYYAMQYDWDWKRAERELQAALASGDNAGAEENYAALCLIQGRRAEANKHIDRARQISPNDPNHAENQANILYLASRFADAEEVSQSLMRTNPNAIGPKLRMAPFLAKKGKLSEALKMLAALPQEYPNVQMTTAIIKARAGDNTGALRLLGPLEKDVDTNGMFYYNLALAYSAMGDAANAAKWLERSMDAREGPALYIRVDPALAAIQNAPAVRALKKRMGLDW